MYVVILAGGGGTRLWPLSRPERPKPFLDLIGGESLLQRTVHRLAPLVDVRDVFIVTDQRYAGLARAQLPELLPANVIAEPLPRNTAAAVALAATSIDRPDDAVMVVLPADHLIEDAAGFRDALAAASELADRGGLVTLGVTPSRPEAGYGYVEPRQPAIEVQGRPAFQVERFVEKPDIDGAAQLIARGASWNAGIFAWQRGVIRAALAEDAADVWEPLAALTGGDATEIDPQRMAAVYADLRAVSIDYAVLEPASVAGRVWVVPIDVGWSDLGSWTALRDAWLRAEGEGAVGRGPRIDRGSSGTLVFASDRPVVTIGLHDTIVVDTPDGLLVCAADRAQEVRLVGDELALLRGPHPATALADAAVEQEDA